MMSPSYWLDLFSATTWAEFLKAGGTVSGFRERRRRTVQQIKVGDYLICYLIGISRFIGMLEVTSPPYEDSAPIWNDAVFPCRVGVKILVQLTPETAVPIHDLRDRLSIFHNLTSTAPQAWTGHLRGSPVKWTNSDGEAIFEALREAEANPTIHPVDKRKLSGRPKAFEAPIGPVTIPEGEDAEVQQTAAEKPSPAEVTKHTEIQFMLLKLGNDMGFDVWVAKNDRNRTVNGKILSQQLKLKMKLPLQFDEATTRTIELIDVLWLKGNAIVAAFEVESTTSIYSGLLRMSDLVAMQPNLNIPLYLVAPDERREKVFAEVNRPTFSRMSPPLVDVCRFISFSALMERVKEAAPFVKYLKPEFLEELSEACEVV